MRIFLRILSGIVGLILGLITLIYPFATAGLGAINYANPTLKEYGIAIVLVIATTVAWYFALRPARKK